jgi:hypothetical protein
MLARQWIDYSFRQLWDHKLWSWQRRRSQFLISAQYNTGTVDVARGSLDVVGAATAWTTDLVNRQFRVGLQTPIYTIIAVDDTAQTLTLDQPWGGGTVVSAGYTIYNAYVTVPSDFQNFIDVTDPQYNWRLNLGVPVEDIDSWDAQRATAGTAYTVVNYMYSSGSFNTPPLPMYEIWPHQKSQYVYPVLYVARPPDLSDAGAALPRYIRGDVLLEFALAQAARWPGPSTDARNPYFNLALAQAHDARAMMMLYDLARTDDEIMTNDVTYSSLSAMPFAAFPMGDSRWLQSHDW